MLSNLRFDALRAANATRCPLFKNAKGEFQHSGRDWLPEDWSVATLGEMGEAANILKKIRRGDNTIEHFRPELVQEFADVVIYLDMMAESLQLNLGWVVPLISGAHDFERFRDYNIEGPDRWDHTSLNRRMAEAFMHMGVILSCEDMVARGMATLMSQRINFAVSTVAVLRCIDYMSLDCEIDLGNAVEETFNRKSEQLELDVFIFQNRVSRGVPARY